MTISVTENTDGTFTIDWDQEDPQESLLNSWTEEDFTNYIRSYCEKLIAESDDPDNASFAIEDAIQEAITSKKRQSPVKTKATIASLVYSSDLALFPYVDTFPYRLEDKNEKKTCYFQCESHARKYIDRHKPEYNLYCYSR